MRINKMLPLFAMLLLVSSVRATNISDFERGKELYHVGRWIEARTHLIEARELVEKTNKSELQKIDYYLTLCAIELDYHTAEDYLSKFKKSYPQSVYANDIHFAKALILCSQEQYDEAKVEFEALDYAALNSHEKEKYNIRMGYISFIDGDYDAAKRYMMYIEPDSDLYDHAIYYRSYISYSQSKLDAAKSGFSSLLASDTYAPVAPFFLLQIDFAQGKYEHVLVSGEELIAKASPLRKIEISRTMAESAYKLERYNDAIGYIEQYIGFGGEMGREENYILGFSLYRAARYEEAVAPLRASCGTDDELTQNASYNLAACYLKIQDKKSALKSFAMASNGKFNGEIAEDALYNYGKLQYELGGGVFNETINVLTRYVNEYPNSERIQDVKSLLVASYYNSRNYDAAYKAIKEIDDPDSEILAALQKIAYYRGLESFNAGDYQSSLDYLKESEQINISPKYYSLSRFWQGEIAYAHGDYKEAERLYTEYLTRSPKGDDNYNNALFNLGYCKLILGDSNSALGYFNRFVDGKKLDGGLRANAYNRIGDINYGKREFIKAKANYSISSTSQYDDRYYAEYQIALIEGILGNSNSKIAKLKEIVAADSGSYKDNALYELGRTYIADSQYQGGVVVLESFINKYPNSEEYPHALSGLGLAYLNLGNKSKSISYYDRAIKAAPGSSVAKDALQGIREIYVNEGNVNKYFEYAESVGLDDNISSSSKDSLTFASARHIYMQEDSDSSTAIIALKGYVDSYPNGFYANDALLYLSDCYLKTQQRGEAIETLKLLVERGASQYSERVYDRLSQLTFADKRYNEAAEAYRNLYDVTKEEMTKKRAMSGYAKSTIASANDDVIMDMADDVISHSDSGLEALTIAQYHKASILWKNNQKESALDLYKALSQDPHSEYGAEANFRLIEYAYDQKELDKAEEMVYEFADTQTKQAYWLAKGFVLLGDIYVLRGDVFQARATYQSIIDGYASSKDGIIDEVNRKIANLKDENE